MSKSGHGPYDNIREVEPELTDSLHGAERDDYKAHHAALIASIRRVEVKLGAYEAMVCELLAVSHRMHPEVIQVICGWMLRAYDAGMEAQVRTQNDLSLVMASGTDFH